MPLQFKRKVIAIPGGRGAKTVPASVRFDSRVISSEIVLAGFKFNFRGADTDHHIDEIEIAIVRLGQIPPDVNAVLFQLECRYQDRNADDDWDGRVDVVVVADVDLHSPPIGPGHLPTG